MRKYEVYYYDYNTGADSPIDIITVEGEYTAEEYIEDLDPTMYGQLDTENGEITLEEVPLDDEEIMVIAGCSKYEAHRHFLNGSCVYEMDDYIEHFDEYTCGIYDEDESVAIIEDLKNGIPQEDHDIVTNEGKTYYIEYVL